MTLQHRSRQRSWRQFSRPGRASRRLALLGLACALLSSGAEAAGKAANAAPGALPRYGVSVYSDLCLDRDSGEMGGQRVTLHRFAEADSVIYEFTAGALSLPQVAADVALDGQTGVLTFSVLDVESQARTVIGKFSRDGATLTLEGGYCGDASIPMKLPKVTDFSRKPGFCKPCPAPKEAPDSGSGASLPAQS